MTTVAPDTTTTAAPLLDFMMDAYQTGDTIRLIQSFSDEGNLGSTAFVYDNALAICAYLVPFARS